MAINAAAREIAPKSENAAFRTVNQCVIIVPGCMTQVRIDISAIVNPSDFPLNALLLRTCPIIPTKTVTNDSSMVFAIAVHSRDAVAGGSLPFVVMCRPYRGL